MVSSCWCPACGAAPISAFTCVFDALLRTALRPAHEMLIQLARLFGQHDRNAVADRIGELGGARDQLLLLAVIFERPLGEWAHEDFEQFRIDAAGGTIGC